MNPTPMLQIEWMDAKQVKLIFSIGKTTLYHLAATDKIQSVSLRENDKQRGKRLFCCHSIPDYLHSLVQ